MTQFVIVQLLIRVIGSPHNLQDSIFNVIHLLQCNSFHSHVVLSNVFLNAYYIIPIGIDCAKQGPSR